MHHNLAMRLAVPLAGIFIFALVLTGCAPSAASIAQAIGQTQSAWTPAPSRTAYPTLTARPTYTQPASQTPEPTIAVTIFITLEVTRIVDRPVTVTPTVTPINSPTITPAPSNTPIPSNTPLPTATPSDTPTPNVAQTATAAAFAALTAAQPDGNYLVNIDIAPDVTPERALDMLIELSARRESLGLATSSGPSLAGGWFELSG